MEGVSEIVEDWWDLVGQVDTRAGGEKGLPIELIAAILLMAREIKYNREDR